MEMLKACDIVCSPGLPDDFNRYRLPSRLVKAMAMAKPILTCRCGFGESLEHGGNAFLMEGADPESWAVAISMTHDVSLRTCIGELGQKFAAENFASLRVAGELKAFFQTALAAPPHRLADFISISADDHSPKIGPNRRNLHASSMSFALKGLEKFTHSIDTVVHLGSGNLAELNDYCRLGARRIHLVASSPEISNELRDFAGGNGVITVDETCESFSKQLLSPSDRDLLVIETELHEWPAGIESLFRWIAVRADRHGRYFSHLAGLGYREVPLPVDYANVSPNILLDRHRAAVG